MIKKIVYASQWAFLVFILWNAVRPIEILVVIVGLVAAMTLLQSKITKDATFAEMFTELELLKQQSLAFLEKQNSLIHEIRGGTRLFDRRRPPSTPSE